MKKLLSLILALIMCIALLPAKVLADDNADLSADNMTTEDVCEHQVCDDEVCDDGSLHTFEFYNETDDIFQTGSDGLRSAATSVSQSTVENRIKNLQNALNNQYFTTDQQDCGNDQCSKCKMTNVIKTAWFSEKADQYGLLIPTDSNWWVFHWYYGNTVEGGYTCAGFANYAGWYLFANQASDSVRYSQLTTGSFNYDTMQDAMIGDVIGLGSSTSSRSHSAVVIKVNQSNVEVIDCNWGGSNGLKRQVKTHTISYSSYNYVTISRATNYVISPEDEYLAQCTAYPTYGTVNTTASTTLKSLPCSKSTSSYSTDIATLSSGTSKDVIAVYKNTAGNYWYKTTYNGQECYLYAGNTSWNGWKGSDISFSNATNPSQITQGNAFSIKGTISSTYNTMTALYAYCYPGSATSGTPSISSSHTGLSVNTYSLGGSTLDNNLKFNNLSTGNYTYVLKVKCKENYSNDGQYLCTGDTTEYIIHSNSFTVVSSSTPSSVTEEGEFTISVPANLKVLLYNNAGDSSSATYFSAQSSSYNLYCTKRTTFTQTGEIWYFVHTGDNKDLWFKFGNGMELIYDSTTDFTVYFNANGGSVSTSSKTVTYGETYGTLPTPTRTGYTFSGWYTASSGGSKVTSSTTVTTASDHTLYAHWTANTYTVSFNANGGSVSTSSKTVTYGSTYGTLPTPTLTGHSFDGWYTSANGGSKVTSSTTVTTASDHTLYAHWSESSRYLEINSVNFPDANFRQYIIDNLSVSGNASSGYYMNEEQVLTVTHIICSGKGIMSLAGIENFTALKALLCGDNQLTALDVSGNTALYYLECSDNQLTALEVSKNTALKYLYCNYNQLTALDVSKNTALILLFCSSNQLTALDISKNLTLDALICDNNKLTALDISNNIALIELGCFDNQLNALDVSRNTSLQHLCCDHNQLTMLDVSKNIELIQLFCDSNHLTTLDLSRNTKLTSLSAGWQTMNTQTARNEGGKYTFDLTALVPTGCMANITMQDASIVLNPSTGIVTFPTEVESFTYLYATGKGNMDVTVPLTFKEVLTITTQPKSQTVATGKKATFTVAASSEDVLYQWYYSKDNGKEWIEWSGKTSDTATVKASATTNGYLYRCKITRGSEIVTSKNAKLTVSGVKPKIIVQPKAATVKTGKYNTFKVVAAGSGLKYQWYYTKDNGTKWIKLSGKTSASLKIKGSATTNGYLYRCKITNDKGSVTSKAVKLTVSGIKPKIVVQPKAVSVKSGKTAKFTIVAAGASLKYQWYYSKNAGKTWTKMSGKTAATLSVKGSKTNNGYLYRCIVKNTKGSVTSKNAKLTVK